MNGAAGLALGFILLPLVTALIRARADLARRLAGGFGVPIARPYRPRPENAVPGGWKRYKWIITDPAIRTALGAALGVLAGAVTSPVR